jgi:signal transduction histidine kinase
MFNWWTTSGELQLLEHLKSMLSFVTVEVVVTLLVILTIGWWLRCRPVRRRLHRQRLPVHVPLGVAVKVKIAALFGGVKKYARSIALFFVSIWWNLLLLFTTATVQPTAYLFTFLRQLYLLVYAIARSATAPIIFLIQQINTLIALICYLPIMLKSFVFGFAHFCVRTLTYCRACMRRCCVRVFDSLNIGGAGDLHMAGALDEAKRELDSVRERFTHERRKNQRLHEILEVERRERQELAVALHDGLHNGARPKQITPMDDAPPPGYYD